MRNQPESPTTPETADGGRRPVSAIIMAGGYGTRLKELTKELPKPMIPVAGRPTLEYIVDHLDGHGIEEAAMALHYLSHVITGHFGDRRGNVRFHYSFAPEDHGTAGAVRRASRYVSDNPLLVVSGDVLSNFDLSALLEEHFSRGSRFTIGLTKVNDPSQYGVARTDENGRIVGFVEKPQNYPEKSCWVNAGIYVMDRSILPLIPAEQFFDISRNLIPRMMEQGIDIHGSKLDGHWFDIGTPETLDEANGFFRQREGRRGRGGDLVGDRSPGAGRFACCA